MKFDLVRPCDNCPFRTDCAKGWLGKAAATSFANGITNEQGTFSCHKTIDYREGAPRASRDEEQHCAGALILLEKMNRPNQMMRWMERLHFYDMTKLDMDAPVFDDTDEFIEHHTLP